jgi:hypothetical protein
MGWENLIKGRLGGEWIEYVKRHIHIKNIKLKASDWAPKMIQALWYHMLRLWQYRNDALNENDTKKVAQFKVESIYRDIERLKARFEHLRHKLRNFQERNTSKHYNTTAESAGCHWQSCTWTKQKTYLKWTHNSWIGTYKDAQASDNR